MGLVRFDEGGGEGGLVKGGVEGGPVKGGGWKGG